MERGEIYVGPFAYADSERSKARPQLVLSTGPLNNGPDVVTAMITSSGRRLATPGPGDLVLVDWSEGGPSEALDGPHRQAADRHLLAPHHPARTAQRHRHGVGRP